MRMLFSIGAVLVAGVLAGGDVAGIAAPGPKFEPSKSSPQRLAADRDAQTVDVELVLAVDVSYSMDMDELAIQREGYAQAIQSKEFLQALKLGPNGRIAVTYFEWAASGDQKIIIPWRLVDGPETADAVAAEILKTPIRRASRTSISGAITFAMPLFDEDPYRGLRRVIDISGDGPNNNGGPVTAARDAALEKGIVINGLPIMVKEPSYSTMDIDNLDYYYEDCVIGGSRLLRHHDQGSRQVQGGDPHQAPDGGCGPHAGAPREARCRQGATGQLLDRREDLVGPLGALIRTTPNETFCPVPPAVEFNHALTAAWP
ncbi:hypothetical protein ABIF86_001266 [Bradyrhizobium japonicum]